jgi:hypothetical protein
MTGPSLVEFLTARVCTAPGCERGGKLTRGLCAKHYRAWLDHTPKSERPTAPRFAREFADFVDKTGDCWVWTGALTSDGYGFWSRAAAGERGLAHRISLASVTPPPFDGAMACHHCDNKPCVNPAHLYWGSALDNARDVMERQGVHNKGTHVSHCPQGHPMSGENLRIAGRKRKRICRTCDNARSRDKMRRRREEARNATR